MAKIYYGNQEIGAEQYIDSEHLNDNAVITSKIANNAVTGDKIADGAITDSKLASGVISEIDSKQDELISGENIKTVNGQSILGSGDLVVTTYQTFNPNWKTNGTTKEFCDDVNADVSAVVGMAYLGGVTFSDFPATGLMNADVVVDIIATTAGNKVIRLTLTSGSVAPYHWEYTYWNNGNNVSGWKSWQTPLTPGDNITINSGRISATDTTYSAGTGLSLDGTEFNIDTTVVATQNDLAGKQDVLTAGNNIEINNNVISATDTTYSAGNGLDLSGTEFSVDTNIIATQQDLTGKQDTLISGTNIKTINGESILGSGNIDVPIIEQTGSVAENSGQYYYTPRDEGYFKFEKNAKLSDQDVDTLRIDTHAISEELSNLTYQTSDHIHYIMTFRDPTPSTSSSSFNILFSIYQNNDATEYIGNIITYPVLATELKNSSRQYYGVTFYYDDEGWIYQWDKGDGSGVQPIDVVGFLKYAITEGGLDSTPLYYIDDELTSAITSYKVVDERIYKSKDNEQLDILDESSIVIEKGDLLAPTFSIEAGKHYLETGNSIKNYTETTFTQDQIVEDDLYLNTNVDVATMIALLNYMAERTQPDEETETYKAYNILTTYKEGENPDAVLMAMHMLDDQTSEWHWYLTYAFMPLFVDQDTTFGTVQEHIIIPAGWNMVTFTGSYMPTPPNLFTDRSNSTAVLRIKNKIVADVILSTTKPDFCEYGRIYYTNPITNNVEKIIREPDLEKLENKIEEKQDILVSGETIKTVNNESLLGSGNIQIDGVTNYDDLDNKPIINQETVYTMHAYTDQEQIHQGDAIHFDRSKAAELLEMLENTVDSSNYSVVLMSADMSTDPNEHLTFEAIFDQYDNDAYKFMIRTPYQGFTVYNSNSGGFQSNVDVHGDFYLPTDSSSYYYTVSGSSIVTTDPDWNGILAGTSTISYEPQPENGKYYRHDNNIYKYENNRYGLIILNQGTSIGDDSIALTKASITLGKGSISVGPNLIPADDDSYGSLSGSGTTYVITASYSNPISDVAVGDYLYVKDTGDYAKVLTRTSQSMGWYAEVTVTVDKTLGTNPQNVYYFKSTAGAYGFSEGCSGASGSYSHAEGYKTIAIGSDSHSEGEQTKAVGADSHAEGQYAQSVGLASHAEGYYGLSSGNYSHSEGQNTIAKGVGSHSEGGYSIASGECSHSEGMSVDQFSMQVTKTGATFNVSSSDLAMLDVGTKFIVPTYRNSSNICPLFYVESKTSNSIAIASTDEFQAGWRLNEAYSSSQWLGCVLQHEASGKASHVEGENNIASGEASHVEGKHNEAKAVSQHVFGEYNISDVTTDPLSRGTGYGNYIEIVGNGTSSAKSNARTLDWAGNEYIAGNMMIDHTTLVNQSNSDITVNLPSTSGTLTTDEQLATVAKTGNYNDLTNTPTPYAPINGINFVNTAELQDDNGDSHSSDCTLRFARANDSIHLTGRFTASNITAGTTYHITYVYSGSGADIPIYDSSKSIQILANWGSQIMTDTDYLCTAYNFTTNDPVGYIFHDGQWLYFLASTTISSSSLVYFSTSYLRKYN